IETRDRSLRIDEEVRGPNPNESPTKLFQNDVSDTIPIPGGWRTVIGCSIAFNARQEAPGLIRVNDCKIDSKLRYADLRSHCPAKSANTLSDRHLKVRLVVVRSADCRDRLSECDWPSGGKVDVVLE